MGRIYGTETTFLLTTSTSTLTLSPLIQALLIKSNVTCVKLQRMLHPLTPFFFFAACTLYVKFTNNTFYTSYTSYLPHVFTNIKYVPSEPNKPNIVLDVANTLAIVVFFA